MSDSDFTTIHTDATYRTSPFTAAVLAGTELDPLSCTAAEIKGELNELVSCYVAKNARAARSFTLDVGRGKASSCCDEDDEDDDNATSKRMASSSLGLGLFPFEHDGHKLFALHSTLGPPVGTNCGAQLYEQLVLLSPGPNDLPILKKLCDYLIDKADETDEAYFTTYKWHFQYQYWQRVERCAARPIDSVVLPKAMKERLVCDLDDFTSKGTSKWYKQHGIPYKRSYLLWGSPGAGKTSLIQALAGKYQRSICYLSPSHPECTDDGLKAAVQRVPAKSIIVLEDVDALFSDGRKKKDSDKSSLTFSGVLNALDGVGGSSGQIFVLTTNHREKLDPALIRNGRVDLHVEFTDATAEQMKLMFVQFYAACGLGAEQVDALAERFATSLLKELGEGRTVSCAALQHYFIQMRKASAEEAAANVQKVIEEMEAHGKTAKADKAKTEDGDEKETKEKEDEKKQAKEEKPKPSAAAAATTSEGKAIHIHVH